jgi:hypothetical protein
MANKKPHAVDRVYFVGAGLSAGMRYPVGATLLVKLVKYLERQEQIRSRAGRSTELLGSIDKLLQQYFGLQRGDIDRINVAEFFSVAHALVDNPWLAGAAGSANSAKRASPISDGLEAAMFHGLAAVVRTYFHELNRRNKEPPADIASLIDQLRARRDAIVTFNWDEELDNFLEDKFGIRYLAGDRSHEDALLMLKAHGSVGWYDVSQGIGNDDLYFIAGEDERVPRVGRRLIGYVENELPRDIVDGEKHSVFDCAPVITPPTFAKRFTYLEQQLIWQDVIAVCRSAHEFVFLGYSLPRDDYLTRAAIRSALSESRHRKPLRCLVVDRAFDDDKRLNFEDLFDAGHGAEAHFLQWEFGNDDSRCGDKLNAALERATITRG